MLAEEIIGIRNFIIFDKKLDATKSKIVNIGVIDTSFAFKNFKDLVRT